MVAFIFCIFTFVILDVSILKMVAFYVSISTMPAFNVGLFPSVVFSLRILKMKVFRPFSIVSKNLVSYITILI